MKYCVLRGKMKYRCSKFLSMSRSDHIFLGKACNSARAGWVLRARTARTVVTGLLLSTIYIFHFSSIFLCANKKSTENNLLTSKIEREGTCPFLAFVFEGDPPDNPKLMTTRSFLKCSCSCKFNNYLSFQNHELTLPISFYSNSVHVQHNRTIPLN